MQYIHNYYLAMIEDNNLLLSICIPTYNRSNILDDTLYNLLNDKDFNSNLIEIIVSDNNSTDNTAEIVKKYKIVKYYRNKENILDKNFTKVLSYAKGKYIHLFNDTFRFKKGKLKIMIKSIQKNIDQNTNLLFYNNNALYKDTCKDIYTESDFLKYTSIWSTWIGNFGCWRKDFSKLSNPNEYANFKLLQVNWSYEIMKSYSHTIILFDQFGDIFITKKKGGYNIFNVFINNYLNIIKKNNISIFDYEREKFRLCRYFLYSWIFDLIIIKQDKYSFETYKSNTIIMSKYWYEPYFYIMYIIFYFKYIFNLWKQ